MKFGSVCSGIEAASVAWEPLGWQAAWFSEIEPFPSAVLAHHYPETPNLGDMTRIPALLEAGEVEAPDILCGGTPCQAFSVAGLRRSLDDARGNLSLTFCEIANAIDSVRARGNADPCIVFWENVPGVLSTKDNAFGCFLAGLAGEDVPLEPAGGKWTDAGVVLGPARAVAWRTLDAQFFGLAQRRRRVFVVASARADFDPAAVLLEWEGVRRDSAPSREAGKVAPTIPARSTGGGGLGTDFDCDGGVIQHCGFCRNFFDKYRCNAPDECDCPRCQGMCECHTMTASTYCIKGAAIGRKPEAGPQHGEVLEEACYTLNCVDQHAVAHAFDARQSDVIQYGDKTGPLDTDGHSIGVAVGTDCYNGAITGDVAATLGTGSGVENSTTTAVMQPVGVFQDSEFGVQQYDSAGTLRAGRIPEHQMVLQPAIAWDEELNASVEQAGTLLRGGDGGRHDGVAVAFDTYNQAVNAHTSQTIKSPQGAVQESVGTVLQAMQVRRLTPVECERLQGFPDGYTAIPWRGKPASECPDGPRYKALGNSWAVPVVRWIGERIERSLA